MLQRLLLILTCIWFLPVSAWAVDPNRRISQYAHTAWRMQDGFFQTSPSAVAQTQDGYVWIGTRSGLMRFDGVRFVPWNPQHGERLPSDEIYRLLAARDGGLWIGTRSGLSHWKDQKLTNYPGGPAGIASILEDRKGHIWFGQVAPTQGTGSFCQVLGAEARCYGAAEGAPAFRDVGALVEDFQGNLWVGGDTTVLRWQPGSPSVYHLAGSDTGANGIYGLAAAQDGSVWVGTGTPGNGRGLQRLVQGHWTAFKAPQLDGSALAIYTLYEDRKGALWIGTLDHGIYRIYGGEVDHFDKTMGLSSDRVYTFSEDREGNLWVATAQGVDRFTDTRVISISVNEGLCSSAISSVLASRDGSIWVSGEGALNHLHNGSVSCLRTGQGLPGFQVTSLLEDHTGRLWVGIDDTLSIYENGIFRRIKRPNGSPMGFVTGIAEDAENSVWVAVKGPSRGALIRIQGLEVREQYAEPDLPPVRRVAADPAGGIWLGLVDGDLARYRNGKLETFRVPHDDAALVHQLLANSDGTVLAATSYGLVGWQSGNTSTLTVRNGLPCDEVYGIAFDNQGNLWLYMNCALGEMTSADVRKWLQDPVMRVSLRTLDVLDGVRAGGAAFGLVKAARSQDGRLWFANPRLLQMIDPARQDRNSLPPPVHIEQIMADRKNYPGTGIVRLPALTRDVEIDYTGLSFVAPSKVRFRYRLEGRDETWQEPGIRRQAFYSDLRPGSYRFRVIASNNDGVWNEEGATLDVVVAPAWYQTRSFLVLLVMSGVVAAWTLYHVRMRQVARALNTRFDERLAERTRMARDLHDTLLQTVQGSKMVADNALGRPDDALGMRRAMEQVSIWLGQASTEGRAAVNALRASTRERNDLAEAFRRAIEDCRRQGSLQASLSVSGDATEMHPVVRDEVYRIGYEAIRNTCTHSGGSRLEVELTYARDLILRVSDNGVGIDPAFASDGREGHFGLQGMRERAARIGATLTVVTSAASGTEIRVTVPGRAIFREPAASLFDRMRAHFTK
jgi:signal transduction histidine kinase/ligand-binding sensor domain-containing protein